MTRRCINNIIQMSKCSAPGWSLGARDQVLKQEIKRERRKIRETHEEETKRKKGNIQT